MSAGNDQLRTEIDRKFQPPIDVLLDPSLLVSSRSLTRLAGSTILMSQTQATLGGKPTEPRLGDVYVSATFHNMVSGGSQPAVQKTEVWDFYRGQAEAAFQDDVVDFLEEYDLNIFSDETTPAALSWTNVFDEPDRHERLLSTLEEELSFLQSGGLVLSRASATFEAFRDTGIPTIDLGTAKLIPELRETLTDIGYDAPASTCAFGVSTADSTVDALTANVLDENASFLLYQLGE